MSSKSSARQHPHHNPQQSEIDRQSPRMVSNISQLPTDLPLPVNSPSPSTSRHKPKRSHPPRLYPNSLGTPADIANYSIVYEDVAAMCVSINLDEANHWKAHIEHRHFFPCRTRESDIAQYILKLMWIERGEDGVSQTRTEWIDPKTDVLRMCLTGRKGKRLLKNSPTSGFVELNDKEYGDFVFPYWPQKWVSEWEKNRSRSQNGKKGTKQQKSSTSSGDCGNKFSHNKKLLDDFEKTGDLSESITSACSQTDSDELTTTQRKHRQICGNSNLVPTQHSNISSECGNKKKRKRSTPSRSPTSVNNNIPNLTTINNDTAPLPKNATNERTERSQKRRKTAEKRKTRKRKKPSSQNLVKQKKKRAKNKPREEKSIPQNKKCKTTKESRSAEDMNSTMSPVPVDTEAKQNIDTQSSTQYFQTMENFGEVGNSNNSFCDVPAVEDFTRALDLLFKGPPLSSKIPENLSNESIENGKHDIDSGDNSDNGNDIDNDDNNDNDNNVDNDNNDGNDNNDNNGDNDDNQWNWTAKKSLGNWLVLLLLKYGKYGSLKNIGDSYGVYDETDISQRFLSGYNESEASGFQPGKSLVLLDKFCQNKSSNINSLMTLGIALKYLQSLKDVGNVVAGIWFLLNNLQLIRK